jgi:hypothetical protein
MAVQAWSSVAAPVSLRRVVESMASTRAWSLLLSIHHWSVLDSMWPVQCAALGSRAQTTRPGKTPRATPRGRCAAWAGSRSGLRWPRHRRRGSGRTRGRRRSARLRKGWRRPSDSDAQSGAVRRPSRGRPCRAADPKDKGAGNGKGRALAGIGGAAGLGNDAQKKPDQGCKSYDRSAKTRCSGCSGFTCCVHFTIAIHAVAYSFFYAPTILLECLH